MRRALGARQFWRCGASETAWGTGHEDLRAQSREKRVAKLNPSSQQGSKTIAITQGFVTLRLKAAIPRFQTGSFESSKKGPVGSAAAGELSQGQDWELEGLRSKNDRPVIHGPISF